MARKGKMNRKLFVFGAIIIFVLIIGVKNYQAKHSGRILGAKIASQGQTIKIGAIYDLTGVFADGGKAFQEGTQIAVDQINSQGGINGKKVEVIYEDGTDLAAKPTVNAAQKLMDVDKVQAIMTISYSGLASVERMAEQSQVPVVDTIDASQQIADLGDWVFGAGMYDDGVGMQVGDFAKNNLRLTKVGMLVGKDEYVENVSNYFAKQFQTDGGTITDREEFLIGEKDFRTQLTKIKNSGAQAIFIGHLGEGGLAVKQARELGFAGDFLGTDPFSIADVQRAAGDLLNDSTYFALWRNFDQLTAEQQNFSDTYKARFGRVPKDYLFYNVLGYDGTMVLAEALKRSDLTGNSIKAELYNIKNYPGLSGPISIDSTGINRDPKSAIVMYQDGKIIPAPK